VGLRKELRAHVIQSGATTLSSLVEAARIAEIAAGDGSTSTTSDDPLLGQLLDEMSASRRAAEQNATEIQRLAARLASTTVSTVDRPSLVSRSSSPRRVMFGGDNLDARRPTPPPAQTYTGGAPHQSGRDQRPQQRGPPRGPLRSRSPRPPMQDNRPSAPVHIACGNCGGLHQAGNRYCRVYGVACFSFQGMNHLVRMCRKGRRPSQRGYQNI